jgi:hypothetical protein
MPYAESIISRFWAKVQICAHGEQCAVCCWPWQGARHPSGYGNFYLTHEAGKKVYTKAHVVAWELHHECFLSLDLWGLHTCDNPPCCNYHHIFAGTRQDNVDDMRRKGGARGGSLPGATHPRAKLDDAAVQIIFQRTMSVTQLARTYGVTRGAIFHVLSGRNWRHLGRRKGK